MTDLKIVESKNRDKKSMIRCGIIGLGKMGISHYAIVNAHPVVEVACVCDTSRLVLACLGKVSDVNLYNDYREMLDSCQLDCVIVATPTSSHIRIVSECMERNLHVFVEKPFCLSVTEGQMMVKLAAEKRLVNQVGFHNRFIATFNKAKEIIRSGALGDIYSFAGEAYGLVVTKRNVSTWRSKKNKGGGCLRDYASHVIDLVNYYFGQPDRVSGTVLKKIFSVDVEDAVYSTLLYDNNLSGQLSVNWTEETYRKMSTMMTVSGTKGKIIVDRQECKVYLKEAACGFEQGWNILRTMELTDPVWFYLRGEEYSAQIDYFVKCIEEGRINNINSFESALKTDTIIDMLIKDAR